MGIPANSAHATSCFLQLLPEYQVAHERAVYKAIAIVADTKKVVKMMDREKLAELRAMSKPSIDIEDLMAAIIMICMLVLLVQFKKHSSAQEDLYVLHLFQFPQFLH